MNYFKPNTGFTRLTQIEYKVNEEKESDSISIEYCDMVTTSVDEKKECVDVRFSRKVTTNPKGIFEIVVTCDTKLTITREGKENLNFEEDNIPEIVIRESSTCMVDVLNKVSFWIAQITNEIGAFPLVTPIEISNE